MHNTSNSILCLSFDLDWSPEYILDDFYELLKSAGLAATIFCTHRSEMVDKLLALPDCEGALHPNLQDAKDEGAALRRLRDMFKGAAGVRVHRLYYHSGLLPLFHKTGLKYLSNDLEFLKSGLEPHYDWSELVRLPIYWEDDVHCTLLYDHFDLETLRLHEPGLKVFNFHPVHIYLNTSKMEHYLACKDSLHDQKQTVQHRRRGIGTRTLVEALINEAGKHRTELLVAVADAFLAASPRSEKHLRFMELQEKSKT
jgi:hypothetical protein